MVRRGLLPSRERAREAIEQGRVLVSGAVAEKPARLVAAAEAIVVTGAGPRFVSRGGEKLDAALEHFDVAVRDKRALDAGASTGGFTDCLLRRGATHVVAVDVGYGQMHERLRGDGRVTVRERVDIRTFEAQAPFPLVVADLSFISLRSVAHDVARRLAAPGADVVVLVKPQFEVGRTIVSRGRGVVRDPAAWLAALTDAASALTGAGAAMMGVMVSPLTGADGNVEFLAHLRAHTPDTTRPDLEAVVAEAEQRYGR